MRKVTRSRSIDTVFVLIIFSAFAFSVLMVLSLGAGVYRNISDITREFDGNHTVVSYVNTKMRNLDSAGAVSVTTYGGVNALEIRENVGGREFKTVIYSHDGWLHEVFGGVSLELPLGEGLRVTPADDLLFTQLSNGIIRVTAGDTNLLISPRSSSRSYAAGEGGGQ